MKILTDCIYLPAQKPPKSCQDYSICSERDDPDPFLIICDGCGSSKNTDIGARLLAHSAKSLFNDLRKNKAPMDYQNFGFASIVKANSSSILLGIEDQCLDSTMIFVFTNGFYIQAYMYGDGYLFSTGKDGTINFSYKVSYKGNAPHY